MWVVAAGFAAGVGARGGRVFVVGGLTALGEEVGCGGAFADDEEEGPEGGDAGGDDDDVHFDADEGMYLARVSD